MVLFITFSFFTSFFLSPSISFFCSLLLPFSLSLCPLFLSFFAFPSFFHFFLKKNNTFMALMTTETFEEIVADSTKSRIWSPSFFPSVVARTRSACCAYQFVLVSTRPHSCFVSESHCRTACGTIAPDFGHRMSESTTGMVVLISRLQFGGVAQMTAGGKVDLMRTTRGESPSVMVSDVAPTTFAHKV